ncbi:universal stress protein [Actinoplanes palleronii]|uniref:Universal stress protein n=1 Tax=Actinoplanes palleronii TaxID=113570 RepID=A0ABQ4BBR2_9ACTN|nr:universal stress protein [Actinoplanes palleronii]GIE68137.1 universal stress protein [Actinoplanes palleronii]
MYRSIAVGAGGAGSWQALSWSVEEAERTGSRLVLVHVCEPGSPLDRGDTEPAPAEVELVDPGLARALISVRARLGGQRAVLKVYSGDPATRLVDASTGAGLLVIGAGGGDRTVRQIVRHALCPVVIVRPGAAGTTERTDRVVVGVDRSVAGRMALEFAAGFADQHRLPLTAVHVVEPGREGRSPERIGPADGPEFLAGVLQPWTAKYPGLTITPVVLPGPVADALIQAGHGAPLLVVGDKRRGAVGRIRTGDVPLTVTMDAPCPVAVVPIDQREEVPW